MMDGTYIVTLVSSIILCVDRLN